MEIEIRHVADCPHVDELARRVLEVAGADQKISYRLVDTEAKAIELGFTGSPMLFIDQQDALGASEGTPNLGCRLPADLPSVEHVRKALRRHKENQQ